MEYIATFEALDTGGCVVDLVILKDERVIGISDEAIVVYNNEADFYEPTGDEPVIYPITKKENKMTSKTTPKTTPKTYAGCDPIIAEALRNNQQIKGQVRDEPEEDWRAATITHYSEIRKQYVAVCALNNSEQEHWWKYARAEKPKRIMPPERAIPVLIKNGYKYDDDGWLTNGGNDTSIQSFMFKDMGKLIHDSIYGWPDCILEEDAE